MEDFLVLKQVSKSFGSAKVINDLNLTLPKGQMVTLLGPSGCGKTTVLRLVAGLEAPTSGEIYIDGQNVTHSAIQERDIGIVFQSYALFPHMSIGENVGYGLKMQGVPKNQRSERVKEALELVDLAGFENRYVDQISGGQQQRVALARALILKPKVLLFDEPLSNLDANLRRAMREKIRELQQQLSITSLYVTHDQSEAFAVSDQVIVMDKGVIKQQDTAKNLYLQPNSRFLANFMGEATLLEAQRQNNQIVMNGYEIELTKRFQRDNPINQTVTVGIRPEAINLKSDGSEAQKCEIKSAVYMGNHWEVQLLWHNQIIFANISPDEFNPKASHLEISPTGLFVLND